jgi:hypothetical protein
MARWEHEDVSNLNLPDDAKMTIELYDKCGMGCENAQLSFAKMVTTETEDRADIRYYVRFNRGELVDPHSVDYNRNTQLSTLKKVNERCFNQYVTYLKTKNRLYFTRSRRLSREN